MATKIRDIIDYYTGHEVSDDIKDRVLERISGSADSEEANDAYHDLWDKADSAYMSEDEISTAYNRIFSQDDENEKANVKTLQIFTWARVAAVVVPLLLLVVFGKLYVEMSNQLKESQMISMLQEHTISDESKVISLADGTKIRLSQSSLLLYPSSFQGSAERKVFLSGEAFFDIKHDDKQPFHVSTPYFEITDLGTSFAVSSYTNEDEVSTTLKTGKIELRVVGQDDKVYSMKPNDQLIYNVRTQAVSIRQVAADDDGMSWRNKSIDLNDVTLAEAAHIMGKAYGVKFTFLSKRYQNTKVTVHFNRGETLQGAMSVIQNLIPGLEYEVKKDTVTVK